MTQSFRPIPGNLTSGLVAIAPNIWTIEAKECVCYRPPMQPRYPYPYRESGTVIFTDLIVDFDPATFSPIAQVTTRWNQMYRHTPLGIQLAHTLNRSTLRNALQTIRDWEPERAIVAHSPWLCVEGKHQVVDFLDSAFNWLAPKSAIVESVMTGARLLTLLLIVLPIYTVSVLVADIIAPKLINDR